jgi:hypothetical protein
MSPEIIGSSEIKVAQAFKARTASFKYKKRMNQSNLNLIVINGN